MIEVVLHNSAGDALALTYSNDYLVRAVTGTESADPNVRTTKKAYTDGSYITQDAVEKREVSIDVIPINIENAQQKARDIIDFIVPHEVYTITVSRNGRTRSIKGVLNDDIKKSKSGAYWTNRYTVEFVCVESYWLDANEQEIAFWKTTPLLTFPLTFWAGAGTVSGMLVTNAKRYVVNKGAAEFGVVATIQARAGRVVNPTIRHDSGKYVRVLATLEVGDVVTISTVPGEKYILLNGEKYMRFDRKSAFFQIPRGASEISVEAEEDTTNNMSARVVYRNQYSGV
jgi:hypothetical protein